MKEVIYALPGVFLTILCWGAYGSVLHKGQEHLNGDRLKPLICVGIAYLVIAVILPIVLLSMQGKLLGDWSPGGISWSLVAGSCGAFGALGIILALTAGGKPTYVMPLVFGCAPIVNVIVTMWFTGGSFKTLHPAFIAGLMLVSLGAVMVLVFKPAPPKKPAHAAVQPAETEQHDEAATDTEETSPDSTGLPE